MPALQKGSWQWGGNAGPNGVGYIRRFGTSEAVVGLAKDGNAVTYTLPSASAVTLTLFDVLGRTVATLVDAKQSAGTHHYTLNTSLYNLSSGVYFYRLQASGANGQSFVETKKMLLTQ